MSPEVSMRMFSSSAERRGVLPERAKLNSKYLPLPSGRQVDAQYGVSTLSGTH